MTGILRIKLAGFVLAATIAVPAIALSAEPTTRPLRPNAANAPGLNPGLRRGVGAGARLENFSAEEVDAAVSFFNENSPNRMKYYRDLREGTPARIAVTRNIVQAFRPIQNFKDKNPELYDMLVQQVKLRDEAFVLIKNSDGGTEAESRVRDKAEEIVNVFLQSRHLRLQILQAELDAQQTQLAKDESDKTVAVTQEVNRAREDERRLTNFERLRQRGQSMLDVDFNADALADIAPIPPAP